MFKGISRHSLKLNILHVLTRDTFSVDKRRAFFAVTLIYTSNKSTHRTIHITCIYCKNTNTNMNVSIRVDLIPTVNITYGTYSHCLRTNDKQLA